MMVPQGEASDGDDAQAKKTKNNGEKGAEQEDKKKGKKSGGKDKGKDKSNLDTVRLDKKWSAIHFEFS